jgi:hypothetical protein
MIKELTDDLKEMKKKDCMTTSDTFLADLILDSDLDVAVETNNEVTGATKESTSCNTEATETGDTITVQLGPVSPQDLDSLSQTSSEGSNSKPLSNSTDSFELTTDSTSSPDLTLGSLLQLTTFQLEPLNTTDTDQLNAVLTSSGDLNTDQTTEQPTTSRTSSGHSNGD